jgi:PAS domain S-box-containing protein
VESLASQASISLETAALFERIEQERSRLQAVVSTVPVGLTISDAAFSEVRVNPYGAMLLGVPADANLIDPQFYSRFQFFRDSTPLPVEEMPTARARRGEYVSGDEIEVALSTGRRITILANAAPIRDREGKIVGSVSAFTDITILKQLQHELDVRRREAEESASRKTRFLAAVSHDIRTPANAISLLAELIQRTAASPELAGEIPELAKELHSSAMLLVNLVSDVLDLTRLDTGKIALQESEFSFRQLMEEECKALEPLARQKGLALACRPPEQVIHLRSDRVKLGRVLANLIGNAIKFTEKGSVAVEGIREEGKLLIRVTDTGPGIPADMLERIFDEFFQLRNRNRNLDTGSGLGLTISQRLIEALGGILTVQSEPGKGSTFTIALPDSVIVPGAGK